MDNARREGGGPRGGLRRGLSRCVPLRRLLGGELGRDRWRWLPQLCLLLFLALLGGLGTACQTSECYVNGDCGTGTCCQGACVAATPIPIGPSSCEEGCQCATWLDGTVERAQCLFYDKNQSTQCTRACASDADCLTSSGLQGRCLTRDEAATLDRLCVWEAP